NDRAPRLAVVDGIVGTRSLGLQKPGWLVWGLRLRLALGFFRRRKRHSVGRWRGGLRLRRGFVETVVRVEGMGIDRGGLGHRYASSGDYRYADALAKLGAHSVPLISA